MIDSTKYLDIFRTLPHEQKYELVKTLLQKIGIKNRPYIYLVQEIEKKDVRTDHVLLIICEELLAIYDRENQIYKTPESKALWKASERVQFIRALQQQSAEKEKEELTEFINWLYTK